MLDIEWRTRRADVGALDAGPPSYGQGQCVEGDGGIDGGGSGGDDGNERWEADESRCGGGFVGEVGEW